MRKNSVKNTRINGEVLKELSNIIRSEIKDPRINPMTSVVAVEVAPDLKTCKAYISVLGDEKSQKDTITGLKSAEGYIRRQLARTVNLRNTPEIRFILDQSIEYGINMSKLIDGDCVGSTLGLYNYIRKNLPECEVTVYLEKPSDEFNYLSGINDIKHEAEDKHFDLFVVLDCSSMDRIEPFMSCFENADKTICIDHHISNNSFADVNYVEPQSSSACEVLYTTFDEDKVDKNVAECIYTGIIHDTGVFKYSCTSRRTMDIAGKMMEMGIDYSDIIDNSFYKKSYIQNQILGRALLESVLFYDGRCIFSSVSIEEMNFYGVTGKELGGIIEQLRLTDGVEVAIFLYETDKDEYKVSLRSKKMIDVARIATAFGGGGHVRAAGFSAKGNVHSIVNKIGEMIEQQYNEDNA